MARSDCRSRLVIAPIADSQGQTRKRCVFQMTASMEAAGNSQAGLQAAQKRLAEWPRLILGHFPTPVRELCRLRNHLGCRPRLWVKNDDYSGPAFGGNKVRKLEYFLARAVAEKVAVVFTAGGITSNHARVTAGLCARLGLPCELVLNIPPGQPNPASGRPASLLLDEMFGARIHFVERREDRVPEMERLAREREKQGKRALVIPIGASTPMGALGLVEGARELSVQAAALKLNLRRIFHATSSGGTQAGLLAGVKIFGPEKTKVIGISVEDPAQEAIQTVRAVLSGVSELLGLSRDFAAAEIEVDERFIGAGYAIPSAEGNAATELLARLEGVVVDPVYTAKAMAGFLHRATSDTFAPEDDLLFWHTGGQLALFQEVLP
jgi:L-cysteate sulfo-lyase